MVDKKEKKKTTGRGVVWSEPGVFILFYFILLINLSFYLFLFVVPASAPRLEGNVLFNDVLSTFYLRLYGVRHMMKDYSDSERGIQLPPHWLIFPISSKGYFICIPQTG